MVTIKNNQQGVAAIIVVTALISVVILIVTGFASIVSREQRQALDQQLSIQAKYAAESVINKKIAEIRNDPAAVLSAASAQCSEEGETFTGANAEEIKTTCVTVNPTPSTIQVDDLTPIDSKLFWLDPGNKTLDKIVISWQQSDPSPAGSCLTSGYNSFPSALPGGDSIGMIRFDLTRVQNQSSSSFTSQQLRLNNFGGVLHPRQSGSAQHTYTNNTANQPVVFGTCGVPNPATVPDPKMAHAVIDVPNNTDKYFLRLIGIYKTSQVTITGVDNNSQLVPFSGNQISLEATVRVSDVTQKVHVRIPTGSPPSNILPDFALQITDELCKRYETQPYGTNNGCNDTSIPPSRP